MKVMKVLTKVFTIMGIVADIFLFLYSFIFLIISGGGVGGGLNIVFLIMAIVFGAFSIAGIIVGSKIISSLNIEDKKAYLGFLGLIFLSFLGGLFYLIWEPTSRSSYSSGWYGEPKKPLDSLERAAKVSILEKQFKAGQITPDEYKRRLYLLDGGKYSTSSQNKSMPQKESSQPIKKEISENERIDLLVKYKKLLDDGVITQDEFELKKKSLLNSDDLLVEETKNIETPKEEIAETLNEEDRYESVSPSDIEISDYTIQVKNGRFALSSLSDANIKDTTVFFVVFDIHYKTSFEEKEDAERLYNTLKSNIS